MGLHAATGERTQYIVPFIPKLCLHFSASTFWGGEGGEGGGEKGDRM